MKGQASKALEKKVLSYLIEYPDEQHEYMPRLSVDDFYHNREIFDLYKELYENDDDNLDSPTLYSRTDGEVTDILRTSVNPAEIDSLFDNLRDLRKRRELVKLSKKIEGVVQSEDSVKQRVNELEKELTDIAESTHQGESLEKVQELQERLNTHLYELRKTDGAIGIGSGLDDLDRLTNGYEGSEYILIAARPSVGKTDMMIKQALSSAQEGKDTAIFTLEMKKMEILKRIISQLSGIDRQKVRRGTFNDKEARKINRSISDLSDMPLWIDDKSNQLDEISYRIQRGARKDDMDIAFIDYMGQIDTNEPYKSMREQKSKITQYLKQLTKSTGVPIVCLVQLNRNVEHREDPIPRLSDLRESGQLEQDADIVLFLARPGMYNEDIELSETKLKIGKQRNGPLGMLDLHYDLQTGRFEHGQMG